MFNSFTWVVGGTLFVVIVGLAIARFADGMRGERMAKSMIFIPAAISLAGAGIIWKFVYAGPPFEVGLANQVAKAIPGLPASLGGEGDKIWLVDRNLGSLNPPASAPGLNTFLLVVIFIWAAAGLATVFFSAAIKGVPDALIDAARVDGATQRQVFYKVTLPYISATVVAVATITAIGALEGLRHRRRDDRRQLRHEHDRQRVLPGLLHPGPHRLRIGVLGAVVPVADPGRGHEPAGPTSGRRSCHEHHRPDRRHRTGRGAAHPLDRGAAGRDDRRCRNGGGETMGRSVSASLSSRGGRYIVLALVLMWTIPTFGLLVSSVRPENEVKTSGWWEAFIRPKFTLGNYDAVLSSSPGSANLSHFFFNSMKITVPAVLLSVGIGAMAGYAFAWMKLKGREWLFVAVVAMLVVPLQMAMIPLLRLITGGAHIGSFTIFPYLHLNNSVAAVWVAHICFGLPFCIFILKSFMSSLPRDIIEAARVDGAGHLTVFFKLVLPLSVPALASLAIFQFMFIWNDLLIGLVYGGNENKPIIAKLVEVGGTFGQSWHLLTASAFVSMVVPLIVFFALQRYFVRGLLAGAVKG